MLRSLFSGITGLRAHQTMMDVVANNIANVNTIGYKSSNAVFKDTLSQMIKGAGGPQAGIGGTNPAQIGLGVQLAAVTTNFTQGAAQMTGRSSDLMIQGDGFFTVKQAGEQLYTRAGSLSLDSDGRLVTPDGAILQGWIGNGGKIDANAATEDVKLPIGTLLKPVATGAVDLGGNLPAETPVTPIPPGSPAGTPQPTSFSQKITTFDAKGTEHTLSVGFARTAAGWDITATEIAPPAAPVPYGATIPVAFNAKGDLVSVDGVALVYDPLDATKLVSGGSAVRGPFTLDLTKLSQFGGPNTAAILRQDGSAMGTLQSYSISPDGTVNGVFSNGLKQPLAQLALGTFNNPGGLEKVGNTMFRATVNSGTERIGVAGTGGRGLLAGGLTEMSNVDLAAEFTNLIISQRGFQANSRVITASDELLTDLVNMKR